MTPERLEHIQDRLLVMSDDGVRHAWLSWASELIEYIDLLHEDLRLTRQERDQEKHKNMALTKENAALRRGQGRAPEPATPEHPPFHHTHPIPDSTKGDGC